MEVSYKKIWKLLIDNDKKKKELLQALALAGLKLQAVKRQNCQNVNPYESMEGSPVQDLRHYGSAKQQQSTTNEMRHEESEAYG